MSIELSILLANLNGFWNAFVTHVLENNKLNEILEWMTKDKEKTTVLFF